MTVVSMNYLLEAGVHFGHQTKRWNPKMKEYIFTARDDIYIIDLQKTLKKIEEAYDVISEIAKQEGTFLFVGTKKQAQEAAKEEAVRSNMYYVVERWLGGTLTNFKTIRKRINRLTQIEDMEKDGVFELLPKKEVIQIRKEYEKLEKNLGGIREMKKLPNAMIIVDPKKETSAIREARKLKIPVFGIVDTNCDPDDVDYVIPANDDAIRSVKLILSVLNNAICEAYGKEMIDYISEEDKNREIAKEKRKQEKTLVKEEKPEETKEVVVEEPKKAIAKKVEEPKEAKVEKAEETAKPKKAKVEKVEETAKPKKAKKEDLSTLTVTELKAKAKELGVAGYSKMKKEDLLKVLK